MTPGNLPSGRYFTLAWTSPAHPLRSAPRYAAVRSSRVLSTAWRMAGPSSDSWASSLEPSEKRCVVVYARRLTSA